MKQGGVSTDECTHTPGPWDHRQRYNALADEIGIDGRALATVWVRKFKAQKLDYADRVEPWPAGEANARLIAASPRMLAALKLAYRLLTDKGAREEIGALLREIEEQPTATSLQPQQEK